MVALNILRINKALSKSIRECSSYNSLQLLTTFMDTFNAPSKTCKHSRIQFDKSLL